MVKILKIKRFRFFLFNISLLWFSILVKRSLGKYYYLFYFIEIGICFGIYGIFWFKVDFYIYSFIWWDYGFDKFRGGNGCRANGVRFFKEEFASRISFICWRIVIVKFEKRYKKMNYVI